MQRIELDASNWAEIKDVSELRRGDRRIVNDAVAIHIDPETSLPVMKGSQDDDMAAAIMRLVVLNWSLPMTIPARDATVLDQLTLEQDDKLREAIQPHMDAINGKNAPVKDNPTPTPVSAS